MTQGGEERTDVRGALHKHTSFHHALRDEKHARAAIILPDHVLVCHVVLELKVWQEVLQELRVLVLEEGNFVKHWSVQS